MTTRAPKSPAVDPLAQTAPQGSVELGATLDKPADVAADDAAAARLVSENVRLFSENRQLLDDNARLNRAVDELNAQIARPAARPPWGIAGAGDAALTVSALVELHRAHVGQTRYDNRFLAAATRLGDQLATDTSPPT